MVFWHFWPNFGLFKFDNHESDCQQNSRNATFSPLNRPFQSILLGLILIQVLNSKKPGTTDSPAILLGLILIQVLDSEKSCQSNGNSKNATFSKLHT